MRRFRLATLSSAALAAALLLAACSRPPAPAAPPPSGAQPAPQAPAQAPATPKKLKIVYTIESLSYAPLWVALDRGYFQKEGVEAELLFIGGGGPSLAALTGGDAQFLLTNSGAVIANAARGLVAVHTINTRVTLDLAVRKEIAEGKKLMDLPPIERLRALKGLTIGITNPGSATDRFTRYLLRTAGLDPEKDVKLPALGGISELAAALQKGQIDAFLASPPDPQRVEASGHAKVVLSGSAGELPGLDNLPYHVTVTTRDFLQRDPAAVRAVARALARGNNFIAARPEEAVAIMKKRFAKVEPQLIESSFRRMKDIFPRDGLAPQGGWERAQEVSVKTGEVKEPLPAAELAKLWTNDYVKDVGGMSD